MRNERLVDNFVVNHHKCAKVHNKYNIDIFNFISCVVGVLAFFLVAAWPIFDNVCWVSAEQALSSFRAVSNKLYRTKWNSMDTRAQIHMRADILIKIMFHHFHRLG